MLSINLNDVLSILRLCRPYRITFGAVLLAALLIQIPGRRLDRPHRTFLKRQSAIAVLLTLAIVANLICVGPLSTILTLAASKGEIEESTAQEAKALVEDIAEEGIVLLENKEDFLPLSSVSKINVFGWASQSPCYGGTGSGAINQAYPIVSILESLHEAGFETNEELTAFYQTYCSQRPEVTIFNQDWTLPEPPVEAYGDLWEKAREFSDTSMIVLTRVGGEGADLPTDMADAIYRDNSQDYRDFPDGEHYLTLSETEKRLVDRVCQDYDRVLVVYNGANAFELGFVQDYAQIKGLLWCPGTGQNGFMALGRIIRGDVNPSGKLPDTYVYDISAAPYFANIGAFDYSNMEEFVIEQDVFGNVSVDRPSFVNYVEGIYVGYRFYETAAVEGLIDYDKTVQYPFGYGLSYTSFQQAITGFSENGTSVTLQVEVTNTGDTAGKEVAEVYCCPPYENGGLEKASTVLAAFGKTEILQPGESQTLTLSFDLTDLASYDTSAEGAYCLEKGEYRICLQSDSHHVIEERTMTLDTDIRYDLESRPGDLVTAHNRFAQAEGNIPVLSRKDHFANYAEATAAPSSHEMPEEVKAGFLALSNYEPAAFDNPEDVMPVTGAKGNLTLSQLRGASYDDERWEALLDQMSLEDLNTLFAMAGFQTAEIASVGKKSTVDCDGPASINNNFTQVGSIGFPSAVMLAATWNTELARAFGDSIGTMADEMGVSGWYAPAMNTHRSAFNGRNFEYYSEDGLLAGKMAAMAVAGARDHGVYAYIKHFAMNDQESRRTSMLCTWANEQTIREIYLKPFELAVKEGGAQAVMAAYNYIGNQWCGACSELLNGVLREEWGFQGLVLTDFFVGGGFMSGSLASRNGVDGCLCPFDSYDNFIHDLESPSAVLALRRAAKNILYTVANSRAYEEASAGFPLWQRLLLGADLLILGLLLLWEGKAIHSLKKASKA